MVQDEQLQTGKGISEDLELCEQFFWGVRVWRGSGDLNAKVERISAFVRNKQDRASHVS